MKNHILKCGNEEYRKLESQLLRYKDLFNKKGEAFKNAVAGITQLARSDFEMRKAYIYKENYLKMLQDYEYSPYYEKIRDKIKSYSNPEDFYKILQNSRIAEFLEDIQFMYSTSEVNKYLRELAISLGVEIDENEEEYDEEGEEE